MNNLKSLFIFILVLLVVLLAAFLYKSRASGIKSGINSQTTDKFTTQDSYPLSIKAMRQRSYPGSPITIEETLSDGVNYKQYIASYKSDGLKIYALLTVPKDENPPAGGWPVIIFNHGYIPPESYKTTERYVAYVDAFAKNGYIVFKPDYRGHGNSEGKPEGAYYSPAYTIDVLNAVSSIKRFKDVNPDKIGMWGHSMGGNITLRAMVVSKDIKAGVIWSGVVGTYEELLTKWRRKSTWTPSEREIEGHVMSIRQNLLSKYGSPQDNPQFWQSIDPRYFLVDISGPLQLHQGLADEEVPSLFAENLKKDMEKVGKPVELFTYDGADHNISSPNFEIAMRRSLDFFNKYLKK